MVGEGRRRRIWVQQECRSGRRESRFSPPAVKCKTKKKERLAKGQRMNEEAKQKQQPLQEEYIYYITNSLSVPRIYSAHSLLFSPFLSARTYAELLMQGGIGRISQPQHENRNIPLPSYTIENQIKSINSLAHNLKLTAWQALASASKCRTQNTQHTRAHTHSHTRIH